MQPNRNIAGSLFRLVTRNGLVALSVAVLSLVMLRGLDPRIFLLFALPPIFAASFTGSRFPRGMRGVAWAFLGAIALGYPIACMPRLFPSLGGFDPRLAPWQDRILMWYAGTYLMWLIGVVPVYVVLGNLRRHWRREPAQLSQFTCYLGLLAAVLCWVGFPRILELLGFWPVI